MNSENKFKTLITSPEISDEALLNLKSMGIKVRFSCENPNVLAPLRYHTDMQITSLGNGKMVCAPELHSYYAGLLKNTNTEILAGNTVLTSNYPGDIAYNIIVAENSAIHNLKYTDPVILENIGNRTKINVSQGYCACTLCMLNENAFITSDRGIHATLIRTGVDVLLIDDSAVLLNGFDHGFFGGSSVMLSSNLLAVNGNIKKHTDCKKITEFCSGHGVEVQSLSDGDVTDIGSFILCQ